MKTGWAERALGISFVVGLGVMAPQTAEAAEPDAKAIDEMDWAFSACKSGLETHQDDVKQHRTRSTRSVARRR